MEEIITKGNLDTYTQGLKGVLSSMGEAILNAGSSSSAGEEVTITVTNISGDAHVDVKSGDTTIQSITSNGISTVTIPFGIEYTIMGYDSTGLYVGGGVRAVANKMSSSISVDCTTADGVDLGLPSGKIWATKNVGASTLYDVGEYYVHGDLKSSNGYTDWRSAAGNGNIIYDTFTSGDISHDIAAKTLGGDWRMPTYEECQELIDNCTRSWSTDNSYITLTGQNGNSILFFASGYKNGSSAVLDSNHAFFLTCLGGTFSVLSAATSTIAYSMACLPSYTTPRVYKMASFLAMPVRAIRDGSV